MLSSKNHFNKRIEAPKQLIAKEIVTIIDHGMPIIKESLNE